MLDIINKTTNLSNNAMLSNQKMLEELKNWRIVTIITIVCFTIVVLALIGLKI
jgi:hypothetical protein